MLSLGLKFNAKVLLKELEADLVEDLDTDGPNLCTSSNGDLIVVLRHFTSGRKIHGYSGKGDLLYTLNVDDPKLKLQKQPGYLSMDLDGHFLCAADQNRIVLWNSKNGDYVNTITIPEHYNYRVCNFDSHFNLINLIVQ